MSIYQLLKDYDTWCYWVSHYLVKKSISDHFLLFILVKYVANKLADRLQICKEHFNSRWNEKNNFILYMTRPLKSLTLVWQKDTTWSKICTDKNPKQVNILSYVACIISMKVLRTCHQKHPNLYKQLQQYIRYSNTHLSKHTRLNIYKTLARPVLEYRYEDQTITKADQGRLTLHTEI